MCCSSISHRIHVVLFLWHICYSYKTFQFAQLSDYLSSVRLHLSAVGYCLLSHHNVSTAPALISYFLVFTLFNQDIMLTRHWRSIMLML